MAEAGKKSDTDKVGGAEEEIDIDLKDPEVEKAALKIQSKFRGFKTGAKKGDNAAKKTEQVEDSTAKK